MTKMEDLFDGIDKIPTSKFKTDLKFGESGEKWIIKFLKKYSEWVCIDSRSNESRSHSDLKYTKAGKIKYVEVKTDKYKDTGNIMVEFQCSGKDSGIRTTKSDMWINHFVLQKEVWIIKTELLKDLVNLYGSDLYIGELSAIKGGDDNKSSMYVLKKECFKDHFKIIKY